MKLAEIVKARVKRDGGFAVVAERVHEFLAPLTGDEEKVNYRIPANACEQFHGANRATLIIRIAIRPRGVVSRRRVAGEGE